MRLSVLIAAGILAGRGHAGPPEKPAETWRLAQAEISLGTVNQSQEVPVTFEVKNDSDAPLPILSVESSCHCISLQDSPKAIPAHGSGLFHWIFYPTRVLGPTTQSIVIETTNNRTLTGNFSALVEQTPAAAPTTPEKP